QTLRLQDQFDDWVRRLLLNEFFDDSKAEGTGIFYFGEDWKMRSEEDRSMGSIHASARVGDYVRFIAPQGTKEIVWVTGKGPLQGKASVFVCGQHIEDVNLKSALKQERVEMRYAVPETCSNPIIQIQVLPVIKIPEISLPEKEICPPHLPCFTVPSVGTPEVIKAGEVQVDGFEAVP
ncbi:MAG: hypothetical protein AABX69_00055, partial [Nanoarchaeota archaeon]